MTTPNLSWGHININVSDLDTSIAFYEKLGFSLLIPVCRILASGRTQVLRFPLNRARRWMFRWVRRLAPASCNLMMVFRRSI